MRTGAGAAVGIVTELVDVHATLSGSITAFDIVRNGRWGRLGRLLKGHSAGDTGIASKDRNCTRELISYVHLHHPFDLLDLLEKDKRRGKNAVFATKSHNQMRI